MYKLLTFDVSHTLLSPVKSASEQYAKVLAKHGNISKICLDTVQKSYENSHEVGLYLLCINLGLLKIYV